MTVANLLSFPQTHFLLMEEMVSRGKPFTAKNDMSEMAKFTSNMFGGVRKCFALEPNGSKRHKMRTHFQKKKLHGEPEQCDLSEMMRVSFERGLNRTKPEKRRFFAQKQLIVSAACSLSLRR